MKFQATAFLLAAASSTAFTPLSTNVKTSVALRESGGLSVDLPSVESQVSCLIYTICEDNTAGYSFPDLQSNLITR